MTKPVHRTKAVSQESVKEERRRTQEEEGEPLSKLILSSNARDDRCSESLRTTDGDTTDERTDGDVDLTYIVELANC